MIANEAIARDSARLRSATRIAPTTLKLFGALMLLIATGLSIPANASVAWGSINNFDTVNDTGVICHGFEIEIDGIHSRDITYTYDWNHYGVPRITEDNTDPLLPKVFVRYQSPKNPDGTWAAFTDVPSAPILPTDGHQFTNPSVNFGGEHFGVGFYGAPAAIKYSWLKDDGAGNLIFAGAVNIATPTFTYFPPAAAPAQVVAAIVPPPPPDPPVLQFGPASWVKDTKTTSHNNNHVRLRDLVSDDPNDPNDKNWQNGEADEVETEWRILQTDFNAGDGGVKGKLEGAGEDLPNGDEVITRRYDFFKYIGPFDAESGEAMADQVGVPDPDGIHYFGLGVVTYNDHIDPLTGEWVEVTVDLSTVWVVGEYIGAQMAGFDAEAKIGLIDHLQDGEIDVPYVERSIVIGGTAPVFTVRTGALPAGMTFDEVTGILSGTPTESGVFTFDVHSTDAAGGDVTNTYTLTIAEAPVVVPPTNTVTTSALPAIGGSAAGGGTFNSGTLVTVVATPNPGYAFVNWTEGGVEVSTTTSYAFTLTADRSLVANFVQTFTVTTGASPPAGGTTNGDGTFNNGVNVTVVAAASPDYNFVNWTEGGVEVSNSPSYTFPIVGNRILIANFARITFTIDTSASPPAGGISSGGGVYNSGDPVTVVAAANPGYNFASWTEGGSIVSLSASYTFAASANRSLVANFSAAGAPAFAIKSAIAVKSGGFTFVTAVIRNDGTGDAQNVMVDGATLGTSNMVLVSPGMLGSIPVGGTGRIKMRFANMPPGIYPLTIAVSFNGGASTTPPLNVTVK